MDLDDLRTAIVPILKHSDVVRAGVFGSVARGDDTDESDIDVVVEFRGKKSLFDMARLKLDLEDCLRRPVDVLTYSSINPKIRDIILDEQKALL